MTSVAAVSLVQPAGSALELPANAPTSAIAVFSSRENPDVLKATVVAALRAALAPAVVDVVVNGNLELAQAFASQPPPSAPGITLRVWHVRCGDKAHAWNRYLSEIWPGGDTTFFVDGYARLHPSACGQLASAMAARGDDVLAGSGVPTAGRTARRLRAEMLAHGGIHGNFYAVKGAVVARLRAADYRLPLGIYRTDPTLAAALNFALDPTRHEWEPARIFVHPEASWDVDEKPWWRWNELRSQFRRVLRQGQGVLENRAVRHHFAVQRRSPQAMPRTAAELVRVWMDEAPAEARAILRNPLAAHALKKLQQPRDWSAAELPLQKLLDQVPGG